MIWLTGHLLGVLALTAVLAGFAGWCWHAWRHADAAQALEAEKARLRADLMRRARPAGAGMAAADGEDSAETINFLQHAAQRQGERVAGLERELASLRAENEELELLRAQHAQLRNALRARESQAAESEGLRARIAQLEDELAQKPLPQAAMAADSQQAAAVDGQDFARWRWRALFFERRVAVLEEEQAQAALPALPAAPAAPAEPNEDEQISQWRLKYFTARVAYLEQRLSEHAHAVPASPSGMSQAKADEANGLRLLADAPGAQDGDGQAQEEALQQAWRLRYMDRRLASLAEQAREAVGAAESSAQSLAARLAASERDTAQAQALLHQAQEEAFSYLARAEAAEAEHQAALLHVSKQDSEISDLRQSLEEAKAQLAAEPKEDGEKTRLRWKTTYLETRVRQLEEQAFAAATRASAASSPSPVAPMPALPVMEAVPAGLAPAPMPKPTMAMTRPLRLMAPRGGAPDDLQLIPGVTPQIESKLKQSGIFHFDQIAEWSPAEAAWIDQYLAMHGQIARDGWIGQAGRLARGEPALKLAHASAS